MILFCVTFFFLKKKIEFENNQKLGYGNYYFIIFSWKKFNLCCFKNVFQKIKLNFIKL